ncbi:ACDE family multidrug resistance protein [Pullulanibacillus pueri]|uniref:Multidrug resistance protein n=1 Tax=Pullulanibacillus pueri TaxID=1437324 RepID=A0A8J3EM17_9BACL|nr:MFS transporter [Pullulanibacillus pueri]MBM7682311.1 ACDE family multidrug resistance protein [Pullulanibacillus pueri]GGH80842.1 multidrug resistance protein [Pullulanibacillus pueri]
MKDNKTMELISLASIPLIMTLGNSMLIPVLPLIEQKLKITSLQSSLIITAFSVIAIIFIPVAGYLSDRIGRKKVIIPSLIITAIGGLIAGFGSMFFEKSSYSFILIGRLLQGLGASGAFPVVIPLVGDMFKNEQKVSSALGILETSNTAGKVLSPILGSVFAALIWYFPFLAIPILCLISIIMVGSSVHVPKTKEKPKPFKSFLKDIMKIFKENWKWVSAVFVIGGIIMFVLFGTLFYLSELLESHYHLKGVKKGFIIAIPLFALCVASLVTGKKIGQNKFLMKWLTFSGMVLMALSMFLLSFDPSIRLFLWYLFIGGIGIGVVLPCLDAFITEGIDKENRGTMTSLYSSMRYIGVAAGPPVFAIVMEGSVRWMFLMAVGTSIIAIILAVIAIKPESKKTSSAGEPHPAQ